MAGWEREGRWSLEARIVGRGQRGAEVSHDGVEECLEGPVGEWGAMYGRRLDGGEDTKYPQGRHMSRKRSLFE